MAVNLAQALAHHHQTAAHRRAVELVREELRARDRYKIGKYFHDCSPECQPTLNRADHVPLPGNQMPTCRVLYLKHLQFFAAGAVHQERLFLAANRIGKCTTIRSVIETPEGPRALRDLLARGQEFDVLAWDGQRRVPARASAPFKKPGQHVCYRLTMADGQVIECADEHRLLTTDGWLPLSELLRRSGGVLPASTAVGAPSAQTANACDCSRTARGSQADYLDGPGSCDARLPWAAGIDQSALPSRAGDRGHSRLASHEDDRARRYTRTRHERSAHLSSPGALGLVVAPFAGFSTRIGSTSVERWSDSAQESRRLPAACADRLRSARVLVPLTADTGPFSPPSALCLASNRIIACEPIGLHDVFDFEVEHWHNYIAADLIHHNTEAAAFEVATHLTGRYPAWWRGRRFDRPTKWWAAGDTRQTTRDIIQVSLMGPHEGVPNQEWAGMIEPRLVAKAVRASGGVANCLDTVYVEHVEKEHGAPMLSELGFKSYDQGRRVFQGTAKDGIWLDEEPPPPQEAAETQAQGSSEVYTECLLRLLTTQGILISTYTPLRGMTPFLKDYIDSAVMPGTEDREVDAKTHFYPDQLGQAEAPEPAA